MRNIFEAIKSTVNKVFHSEKGKNHPPFENYNKGPVNPGLEEKEDDVGKKVFERTGQLREGVGQSSTTLNPQETPAKTNHGIKNHSAKKRNYYKGRKPKDKK